ncbi:hypothetical protein D1007_32508 [Hordeum vulgare]|nr:hypothetical protein D1007_32508 [Hordeum vulgare]
MTSPKALKDKIFEKVINPYLMGVLQHPQSIDIREGILHIRDVEGPKKTRSMETRLEAMEQQVFKCQGMVERGLNANYMMITEFTSKHRIDANDIGKNLSRLYDRIDQLQTQIYDLQNQNSSMQLWTMITISGSHTIYRKMALSMNDDQTFLDVIDFGYTETQLESPIGEQPTPSTQHQATPITEKAKSNKGKNWSSEEDKILIAAWGNTSLDSVRTDQNRDAYWARISEYYNSHKMSSWPERNANAINCRYTLINKETARFCGCLQQILNREESGRTIEEKTNDAHIMFKEMDLKKKKPFTLMHCYVELSKYPKWQTKELETSHKKQKKTVGASPGTSTKDLADASSVRTDATSIHRDALEHEQRPDGVKKDKLRKGKADDSACKLSLETVWAAKQEKDDIKEAAKNARYAQQFELRKEEIALKKKEDARNEREDARRQFELDERVMLIDTSGMTDMQKQFYQAKQNEILARRLE